MMQVMGTSLVTIREHLAHWKEVETVVALQSYMSAAPHVPGRAASFLAAAAAFLSSPSKAVWVAETTR